MLATRQSSLEIICAGTISSQEHMCGLEETRSALCTHSVRHRSVNLGSYQLYFWCFPIKRFSSKGPTNSHPPLWARFWMSLGIVDIPKIFLLQAHAQSKIAPQRNKSKISTFKCSTKPWQWPLDIAANAILITWYILQFPGLQVGASLARFRIIVQHQHPRNKFSIYIVSHLNSVSTNPFKTENQRKWKWRCSYLHSLSLVGSIISVEACKMGGQASF